VDFQAFEAARLKFQQQNTHYAQFRRPQAAGILLNCESKLMMHVFYTIIEGIRNYGLEYVASLLQHALKPNVVTRNLKSKLTSKPL
jgi:hypothetical protein